MKQAMQLSDHFTYGTLIRFTLPSVGMMENADGRWQVTATEEAGDGEDYVEDIERFADGDQKLADPYFAGADLEA